MMLEVNGSVLAGPVPEGRAGLSWRFAGTKYCNADKYCPVSCVLVSSLFLLFVWIVLFFLFFKVHYLFVHSVYVIIKYTLSKNIYK